MARADTPTLLALDRWAQILGINPAHFNEGVGTTIMPAIGSCGDVYWQHAWQASGRVSRDEIAREIAIAEEDIANVVGYWPAPKYIAQEMVRFDTPYRPEYGGAGRDLRGRYKSVIPNWGRFIQGGRRAVQAVSTGVAVVYSDEDGDSYDETATITVATTLNNTANVKVYFAGEGGDDVWEIRPARTKEIAGGNFTATFWSWQLIEPARWEALPTQEQPVAENLEASIYVTTVDVYREYTDYSRPSAIFYWEQRPQGCGVAGCAACQLDAQQGCLHIRDYEAGIAVPVPATWNGTNWDEGYFDACRDPDMVKIYYLAGDISNRFKQGRDYDPLSEFWAETIAWLATARLGRPLCSCNQVTLLSHYLQTDLAQADPDGPAYTLGTDDLDNPFGTRRGEVRAWRRVNRIMRQKGRVAVI